MVNQAKISLSDIRVAVLISDGFEMAELKESAEPLKDAGAVVEILAHSRDQLKRGIHGIKGMRLTSVVQPTALIQDVIPTRYHGLLIPGGALSVDLMRASRLHLGFVQNIMASGKPVGVISHGGWLLADSGVAQGKTLTSWPAIQKDLERSGAIWKDQEVIVDENLITSRYPRDLLRFSQVFMEKLSQVFGTRSQAA